MSSRAGEAFLLLKFPDDEPFSKAKDMHTYLQEVREWCRSYSSLPRVPSCQATTSTTSSASTTTASSGIVAEATGSSAKRIIEILGDDEAPLAKRKRSSSSSDSEDEVEIVEVTLSASRTNADPFHLFSRADGIREASQATNRENRDDNITPAP